MRVNAKTTMERILDMEDTLDDLVRYIESLSSAYKSTLEELLKQGLIISELHCRMDSMEKSVKDTNKKITAIRNQIRKGKGRKPL